MELIADWELCQTAFFIETCKIEPILHMCHVLPDI